MRTGVEIVAATAACTTKLKEGSVAAQYLVTGANFSGVGRLITKVKFAREAMTTLVVGTFCAGGATGALVGG